MNADGRVTLRDGADGWRIRRTLEDRRHARALAFSPDGRSLAVGADEADIFLWDPGQEAPGSPLGIPVREAINLKYSPDGRTLAVARTHSPEIILWDIGARQATRPCKAMRRACCA